MKKWIKLIFGLLISVLLIYFILKDIDIKSSLLVISKAKINLLILSFLLTMFFIFLRSIRWKIFLKEFKGHSLLKFYESLNIGLMFNNLLPFRAGDLIQAYLLAKKTNFPKALTFSTVVMERFIDFFPPIIFLLIGSFFIILPKEISVYLVFVLFLGLLFGLFVFFRIKVFLLKILEAREQKKKKSSKILSIIRNLYLGIENFKNISLLLRVVPLTFFIWGGYSFCIYLICSSLGIELPSFFAAFLVQAIVSLSVVIPSSPGYVGTWEFMSILALKVFKVEETAALAFALLSHILSITPVLVVGGFYFIKEFTILKGVTGQKENEN